MHLLRILRLDDSDQQVYRPAAAAGELAVPGAFMFTFADADPHSLGGPEREAFRRGFLGLESLGWGTLVTIGEATVDERTRLLDRLTAIFVDRFGAPDTAAAYAQAEEELAFADRLCRQSTNTILSVERSLDEHGNIRERFHTHRPQASWDGDYPVFSIVPDDDHRPSGESDG